MYAVKFGLYAYYYNKKKLMCNCSKAEKYGNFSDYTMLKIFSNFIFVPERNPALVSCVYNFK